jgi:hypothetical protein
LHFNLGFKGSGRSSLASPGATEVAPGSARCLPRASQAPFRVLHERLTSCSPSLPPDRPKPAGARSEPPVPHGVPLPCYAARRTRTLHSGPKARALSPGGPGFSPVARLSCRVVLRSCFRPGTRLGLPRLPPRAALGPVRDRVSSEPVRVRRPSPCGCPGDLPTWSAPKGSPRHPVGRVGVATTLSIQFSMSTG